MRTWDQDQHKIASPIDLSRVKHSRHVQEKAGAPTAQRSLPSLSLRQPWDGCAWRRVHGIPATSGTAASLRCRAEASRVELEASDKGCWEQRSTSTKSPARTRATWAAARPRATQEPNRRGQASHSAPIGHLPLINPRLLHCSQLQEVQVLSDPAPIQRCRGPDPVLV